MKIPNIYNLKDEKDFQPTLQHRVSFYIIQIGIIIANLSIFAYTESALIVFLLYTLTITFGLYVLNCIMTYDVEFLENSPIVMLNVIIAIFYVVFLIIYAVIILGAIFTTVGFILPTILMVCLGIYLAVK